MLVSVLAHDKSSSHTRVTSYRSSLWSILATYNIIPAYNYENTGQLVARSDQFSHAEWSVFVNRMSLCCCCCCSCCANGDEVLCCCCCWWRLFKSVSSASALGLPVAVWWVLSLCLLSVLDVGCGLPGVMAVMWSTSCSCEWDGVGQQMLPRVDRMLSNAVAAVGGTCTRTSTLLLHHPLPATQHQHRLRFFHDSRVADAITVPYYCGKKMLWPVDQPAGSIHFCCCCYLEVSI